MTKLEYLLQQKTWALNWLAVPEENLPGTLTYEKLETVLNVIEDRLIDHIAITPKEGKLISCYVN